VPTLPEPPIDLEASLTAEVIRLSLAGRAVHLREEATAARFGVGRSALRQALGRLAGKGLIEYLPRRGWRVRAFDEADLRAYLAARECLELKALDLAMPQLDRADLEAMLHGNEPGAEGPRLDNQLHRHLVEKAGNPYIRDFFERHGLYFTTLLDFAAPEAAAVARMAGQHRAILVALLAGDRRAARRELARHIRAQLPVLRRLLRRHGRPTPANGDTP
jgi:DNA-binding GntR family transcriptional regulator